MHFEANALGGSHCPWGWISSGSFCLRSTPGALTGGPNGPCDGIVGPMAALPAIPFAEADAEDMVSTVAHWVDLVGSWLTSEASRQRLRAEIHEAIRGGTMPLMRVIEAAESGHSDADAALRERAAELLDRGELGGESSALLRAYAIRALHRGPTVYPQGRNIADVWLRDIGIAVLVSLTCVRWGLRPSRNRISHRPCATAVVATALSRRQDLFEGRKAPGERQVEKIYAGHEQLAGRLAAALPAA
jgi:hypothetical protein